MRRIVLLLAMPLGLAASPAMAQDEGGLSLGVTGGTLGIGPELGYRVSNNFGARASATFLGISHDVESDGLNYKGDLDLQSFGAVIDLHPFGGGFRLSAGARISDNKVKLAATPTGDVEIGEDSYTAAEVGTLTGLVEPKGFAPTLTIGWGGGLTRGLKFGADIGVMFQGTPKVTELSATGSLANTPAFQQSLARERAEIEGDIDNFKLYPILQFSLGYRF